MPTQTDASQHGIDPDDPPSDIDELYVSPATTSGRTYHVDPDCHRLGHRAKSRRVEIAASWFPPCPSCVLEKEGL